MSVHRSRSALSFFPAFIAAFCMILVRSASARAAEPDIPKIQAGAERGSIAEEIKLGTAYLTGQGVARDVKQAAYWYEKAANSGDPGAQLEIGYFYQAGIGVDRNPARAAQWFERASSSGLTGAKVNLGVAYVWGSGVRKDPAFAAQLFRQAAKRGDGAGACYLGDMYFFGLGIPQDTSEAIHWFELGSKLHNSMAKFNLASTLLNQHDHSRDREAVKLLRESAQAGYVRAKHQLGLMLVMNPAFEDSPGEAVATLEEAAAAGFWKSSIVLGVLARDGKSGMSLDKKSAYYHFKIATLQGGESAVNMLARDLQRLQSELSSSDIQSLDSEANAWMSKHEQPLEFAVLPAKDPQGFPAMAMENPDRDFHVGMLFGTPITDGLEETRTPPQMNRHR